MDRATLRQALRQQRKALAPAEQAKAAKGLAQVLSARVEFQKCQHIALYIANDGEISPHCCAKTAWTLGKSCYLPVLDPVEKERMHFLPYHPNTPLVVNRFGIPEPRYQSEDVFPAEQLDLVLMPLTGFDEAGNRLGMGGGFYDRTFMFLGSNSTFQKNGSSKGKPAPNSKTTLLIGLAHECQKVERIPTKDWDVPMAGIATGEHFYHTLG